MMTIMMSAALKIFWCIIFLFNSYQFSIIQPTGSGSSTTSGCADLDSLCSSDSQLPTPVGTAPPDSQLPTPVGNAPPNTYKKKRFCCMLKSCSVSNFLLAAGQPVFITRFVSWSVSVSVCKTWLFRPLLLDAFVMFGMVWPIGSTVTSHYDGPKSRGNPPL